MIWRSLPRIHLLEIELSKILPSAIRDFLHYSAPVQSKVGRRSFISKDKRAWRGSAFLKSKYGYQIAALNADYGTGRAVVHRIAGVAHEARRAGA